MTGSSITGPSFTAGSITVGPAGLVVGPSAFATVGYTSTNWNQPTFYTEPAEETSMPKTSLEDLALRLDELSVDLDLPELLEISEKIGEHFGTVDSLQTELYRARDEASDLHHQMNRMRDGNHSQEAATYGRHLSAYQDRFSRRPLTP